MPEPVTQVISIDPWGDNRDRLIKRMPASGRALDGYVPPQLRDDPELRRLTTVSLNGGPVAAQEWPKTPVEPGDSVVVRLAPAGLAPATVVALGLVAVQTVGQILAARRQKIHARHAAKRAAALASHMPDSIGSGYHGRTNTTTPGTTISVLNGRKRVAGHIAFAEEHGGQIDMVVITSHGEIKEIESGSVEINGRPSSEFSGVSILTRVGTNSQLTVGSIFASTVPRATQTLSLNVPRQVNTTASTTVAVLRDGYRVNLSLPSGITMTNPVTFGVRINFRIRHRLLPAGSFVTAGTVSTPVRWVKAGSYAKAINVTFRNPTILVPGRYEIEVRWDSETFLTTIGIPVIATPATLVTWTTLEEYREFGVIYPGKALVALSGIPSSAVGGILPTITSIGKGRKVAVYTKAQGDQLEGQSDGVTVAATDDLTSALAAFSTNGVVVGDKVIISTGADAGTFLVGAVDTDNQLSLTDLAGTPASFTGSVGATYVVQTMAGVSSTSPAAQIPQIDNGAWIAVDAIENRTYGAGQHSDIPKDVDLQSAIDTAIFCDTLIGRGTANPIKSGTGNGATIAPIDFSVPGETFTDGTIQVDDTLEIFTGAEAGIYRIIEIVSDTVLRVSNPTPPFTVPSFGATGSNDWEIRGTERRCQFDLEFDGTTTLKDALEQIATVCHFWIIDSGGRVTFIPDEDKPPIQAFSPGNIRNLAYSYTGEGGATSVEVDFFDRTKNWERSMAIFEDPDVLANSEAAVDARIDARGCARRTHAQRIAKRGWFASRAERERISFEAGAQSLVLQPGDVFQLNHPSIPKFTGNHSGRITQVIGTDTLVFDGYFTWAVATGANRILVQRADEDTLSLVGLVPGSLDGETTDRITFAAPFSIYTPRVGDVWIVEESLIDDFQKTLYKLLELTETADDGRQLIGVRHDPAMFDDLTGVDVTTLAPVDP